MKICNKSYEEIENNITVVLSSRGKLNFGGNYLLKIRATLIGVVRTNLNNFEELSTKF